jgi:hypothetical protein
MATNEPIHKIIAVDLSHKSYWDRFIYSNRIYHFVMAGRHFLVTVSIRN